MNFASEFIEKTVPILNELKSMGYKIYIRGVREYKDGVVPKSMFVPGLKGELFRKLILSLYEYDDADRDYIDTALLSFEGLSTEGWDEL